ncbi:MAG: hypothetical protein ABI891_03310 [Acidobacteriota bacterium]
MNNTKWREIFSCLAQNRTGYYLSFIDNPNAPKKNLDQMNLSSIKERGIGDSCGGPYDYKQIHSLYIPKIIQVPKKMRGEIFGYNEIKQETEKLSKSLLSLGRLSLVETDEFIEIYGYN